MDASMKVSDFVAWWAADEHSKKFKRELKHVWNNAVEDSVYDLCAVLNMDEVELQREAGHYYDSLSEEDY